MRNSLKTLSSAFEWDSIKAMKNLAAHGVSFERVEFFEWDEAETLYQTVSGERRYSSFGTIQGRLHCLIWTIRNERIRVISLRKANKREQEAYEQR